MKIKNIFSYVFIGLLFFCYDLKANADVGVCGLVNGTFNHPTAPTDNLCLVGIAKFMTHGGNPSEWRWVCVGTDTYNANTACYAYEAPATSNSNCGPSADQVFSSAPTSGFCTSTSFYSGSVSGNNPWYWTCLGMANYSTSTCSTYTAKTITSCDNGCSPIYSYVKDTFYSVDNCVSSMDGTITHVKDCSCGQKDFNSEINTSDCVATVSAPQCGNGIKETGEQCDNGTNNSRCPALCSSNCLLNNCPPPAPVCGNGSKEAGEQCDDGANNGTCPKNCSTSCKNNKCGVSSGTWKEIAP